MASQGNLLEEEKKRFFHKLSMVSYTPWANSGFKGVQMTAEKGWNQLSEKIAKNRKKCGTDKTQQRTKRDLEVVDGAESKNVSNENSSEFFFHI